MKKLKIACLLFVIPCCVFARDVNVADFGADGKSAEVVDAQIQKAIDECSASGGGEVRIGNGLYNCNSLRLKNGVTLVLDRGATIKMTPVDGKKPHALVHVEGVENAGLRGEGVLDGSGALYMRKDNLPHRPHVLFLKDSKNFRVENITMRNAAFWTFRIFRSSKVFVRGVKIYSHTNFNNDGIDIDGKDVVISDCIIDCDDDGLCLKSDDLSGVENVVITNCVVSSNCNPVKFGTANVGGFRNITISNCIIKAASESNFRNWNTVKWMKPYGVAKPITGIAGIALEAVDGGCIENVTISNIAMTDIQTPIFIRSGHRNKDERISKISNVLISSIVATSQSWISSSITGIKDGRVKNIVIRDCVFNLLGGGPAFDGNDKIIEAEKDYPENRMFKSCLPSYGMYIRHADNITLSDVQFLVHSAPVARPSIVADDVDGLRVLNCIYSTPTVFLNSKNIKKTGNIQLEK